MVNICNRGWKGFRDFGFRIQGSGWLSVQRFVEVGKLQGLHFRVSGCHHQGDAVIIVCRGNSSMNATSLRSRKLHHQ